MEEYNKVPEKQFRLLVVEDDSTLLQLIEKKLPGEGLEIETARDGASAIEIIRGNPPDLLLLDYLLSDMDGSRLVEYIRSKGLEIPFIIMTGFGDEQVAVNLMKLGAQDYVIKDPNFLSLLPVAVSQAKNNIVTKQKLLQAQKALAESEYNYRILVESSRDMIFTTDLNGRFLFVNSNFETITGYNKDELLGKSFIELIEQDFLEVAQEKFVSGLTGREIPFFQANFIAKSGKVMPLELNITVLYDSAKVRKGMLGIGRDVSHRKRYEETLRQNEEYFRTLIQNSSDAIVILNGNGTFRFVSNSLQHIIGYSPEDLESKKLFDIIHQKDIVKALNFFWEVVQNSDQDSTFEIVFNHRDGSTRYVEGIGRNMISNSVVNGIYLTLRDMESRKRLEEQLINAQKMEAVGRLAGGIAHDFNNIMTAIINYSEVIIKSNPDNDNLVNLVLKIIGSAKEAANFTTQLLAFSSKQMYMPKVMDMNSLLSELRIKLGRSMPEYITLGFAPGIDTLNVSIDKSQFEKVIKNLVDNAADAIGKIKDIIVKGTIILECDTVYLADDDCRERRGAYSGSFARIAVRDNGIGIADENQNRLFEPFFSTKQGDPGVGLGLAVAYGIVKQHKGWIEVKSKPNEGSVFYVFIPVHSDKPAGKDGSGELRFDFKGSGEKILLVEDEENVRRLVTESLRSSGFTVLPACDAKEAQKIYKKEKGKFDIIFSDVALPGKTGVEFVNETIKDDRTGVILTSGYFDESWTLSPFAGRNYRFIAKPYVLETLLKCIKEVLEQRQKH